MRVIKSPRKLSEALALLRRKGKCVGFVPTMGCLHEGHLSLVRRARKENDVVVVSIFVNPLQFGPGEDFASYPRNTKRDLSLLRKEKADFTFLPLRRSLFSGQKRCEVDPGPLAGFLCGPCRPGHFRGVVTVVKRLFDIVRPQTAYFGQKDFQQARIIQEMVRSSALPVRIRICPTIREKDGLALSSRNFYLTGRARAAARAVPEALFLARRVIRRGERNSEAVEQAAINYLENYVDKIDYVKIVNPETLQPVTEIRGKALVALACFLGKTRLIDNILIQV